MKKLAVRYSSLESHIYLFRGHRVMLDAHLAELYAVPTFRLNEQIKRNWKRFPEDFMFRLNEREFKILKSHFAISRWGGRRTLPYAFTEQGVAMLSSVLNSERAIKVNIEIMRVFVRIKKNHASNEDLRRKMKTLERKYDGKFAIVFDAIQRLLDGPHRPVRVKGFDAER